MKLSSILIIIQILCQECLGSESRNSEEFKQSPCEKILPETANITQLISQKFFTTGNLSNGQKSVKQCEKAYNELVNGIPCILPSAGVVGLVELEHVCWLINETSRIALLWSEKENRKAAWLKNNNTKLIYTHRAAKNSFDEFSDYLKMLSDQIYEVGKEANLRNISSLFNDSFLQNIITQDDYYWLRKREERVEIILNSKIELFYIRTPVSLFILIAGLLGNSLVVFIFYQHRVLMTSANILLLNLVFVDILNLIINLPFGYVVYVLYLESGVSFSTVTCKLLIYFELLCTGLCTWSLVAMSILRYNAVTPMALQKRYRISTKTQTLTCIIAVWIIGFTLPIPTSNALAAVSGGCRAVRDRLFYTHWNLLFLCIMPMIMLVVFYTLTACRLAKSAEEMPGKNHGQDVQRKARSRGAKVLVTLTIVFVVCYPPIYIYNCLKYWNLIQFNHRGFRLEYIFYYLIYFNSMANPIALYFSSSTFRKYFNYYLRKCFCLRQKTQNVCTSQWYIATGTTITEENIC